MFKKNLSNFLILLSLVITLDTLGCVVFYQRIISSSSAQNIPKTPAGLIFFAGANSDYTGMSADSLRIVNYTLSLYRQGLIENIICLGGAYHVKKFSGSQIMKDYLIKKGVPQDKIFTEYRSYDSYSNWESGCSVIKQNNWANVTLIASPMHIYRLRFMIPPESCGTHVYYTNYEYAAQEPLITLKELWLRIHHEWLAYGADFFVPQKIYRQYLKKTRQLE